MLGAIVVAYFAIAVQYAARTPAWLVPDEPAHYNYIRYIAQNGALPVLRPGDYDQQYLEQFTTPKTTPQLSIEPLRYEFWQPPLYYLLAAPVYLAAGGDLIAMRLLSVVLGAISIVVAFAAVREVWPDRFELALGTAAFVAFVPQHAAMLGGVNNDSLAELLLALTLLQLFRVMKAESRRGPLGLGVLLGLGLLTKGTNYLALPVVVAGLAAQDLRQAPRRALRISRFAIALLPALALGALWWVRNLGVYGGLDVLGLANHNAVVIGQPLTSDWIERMGFGPFVASALATTFRSFWGQFGWMGVPMPDNVYLALGALSVVALLGWRWSVRISRSGSPQVIALGVLVLATFGYYILYNFTFVQHQGRYLFPAIIPLGLVFSCGIIQWTRRLPRRASLIVFAAVFAALAALDVYALYRFVIPSLSA